MVDAQRPRPLPPRDRRHRPRPRPRRARRRTCARRWRSAGCAARAYTREHGDDDPEIRDWTWPLLNVLVVNAGSTSLKLSLVARTEARRPVDDFVAADAVGHRIVHLGDLAIEAALVDDRVICRTSSREPRSRRCTTGRRSRRSSARARRCPDVPHVAVSDSGFHRTTAGRGATLRAPGATCGLDRAARLPRARRASRWPSRSTASRLVVCHLGGGCSVTAVRDGRVRGHDHGLSRRSRAPPMGTRSGSVDPGALLHLAPVRRHASTTLDRELNEESGLAGARRPRRRVRLLPLHVPPREGGRGDGGRARGARRARVQRRDRREPR